MNVGHIKEYEAIPQSFFVRGTRNFRLKCGETVIESFYGIRLPIFGMARHNYGSYECWSQRELWLFGRRGFRLSWREVPGAERISTLDYL